MISKRERLVIFFATNQDEELSRSDVSDKLGCNANTTVWAVLVLMCKDGMLVARRSGNTLFYSAGPTLRKMTGNG